MSVPALDSIRHMGKYARLMSRISGVKQAALLLASCVSILAGSAARARDILAPSVPTSENSFINALDRYHEAASSWVISFGEGMDGWLDRRFQDPTKPNPAPRPPLVYGMEQLAHADGSRMILSPLFTRSETSGTKLGLRVSGRLALPRVSDRLDLVFDSDRDDNDLTPDVMNIKDTGIRSGADAQASLRYQLSRRMRFKPSLEAGLKFKPAPAPRLGLRLRLEHGEPSFTTRLTQKFYWESDDGWGERTSFDFDHGKKDNYLHRLNTTVLWSESSDGVQIGQTLQLFKFLSANRVTGAKLGWHGPLEPNTYVEQYNAHLYWRQRLHRNWLYLAIEPGLDWPKENDFKTSPFIQVALEIVFGDWIEPRDHPSHH